MDFLDYTPYLTINGASKHTPASEYRNVDWNEQNQGFGLIGKKINKDIIDSIGIGQYLNSLGKNSIYGMMGKQKRLLGGDNFHLDAGGRAGLVTGYDLPVVPMLQPMLSLGGKNFDINLAWQPKVPGLTPEVFMLNADYRLK